MPISPGKLLAVFFYPSTWRSFRKTMLSKPSFKSVCLVTNHGKLHEQKLQPWRYLNAVIEGLSDQGHHAAILTDGQNQEDRQPAGMHVKMHRIASINSPRVSHNLPLKEALREINPDVILWHVGLTSFLSQSFEIENPTPMIGIFTSPIYQLRDLYRLGLYRLGKGYRLSALHLVGSLLPRLLLRRAMAASPFRCLVTETETTRRQLVGQRLWARPIAVIPPGINDAWNEEQPASANAHRQALGFSDADIVLLYFGAPTLLRGLDTLIKALRIARKTCPALKLLVLSRSTGIHTQSQWNSDGIRVIDGFLEEAELVRYVHASDAVALPFEIVPSDAPLSLLEAQALGKPVISTQVACIPELTQAGRRYLARPADPNSLSSAILAAARDITARPRHFTADPQSPFRTWQQVGKDWSTFIQSL